jgi:hypothetical protein
MHAAPTHLGDRIIGHSVASLAGIRNSELSIDVDFTLDLTHVSDTGGKDAHAGYPWWIESTSNSVGNDFRLFDEPVSLRFAFYFNEGE